MTIEASHYRREVRAKPAGLAAIPDGVLVSEETVNDFHLALDDRRSLRLQGTSGPLKLTRFH
jgi:putative ABC transport system permease protein